MKKTLLATTLIACLTAHTASANDFLSTERISLSGFGTVAASMNTEDTMEDKTDFEEHSKVGFQAKYDILDNLSATTQLTVKGKEDFEPNVEWAFLSYTATDELRFNVGRQRLPMYKYSDYLDIGYAQRFVTPPVEVYSFGMSQFDGVSAFYDFQAYDIDFTAQVSAGMFEGDVEVQKGYDGNVEMDKILAATLTAAKDWWTIRASVLHTEVSIRFENNPIDPYIDLLRSVSFNEAADELTIHKDLAIYSSLAFSAEKNNWFAEAEIVNLAIENTWVPSETSYYLLAGYQLDNISLYAMYAVDDERTPSNDFIEKLPVDVLPMPVAPGVSINLPLKDMGVDAMASIVSTEKAYTVGSRWDFHSGMAAKIEYTKRPDAETDQILASVDFVF